ncbi:hypothetical protein GCM10010372_62820 [Streptomyces tauricus]|uniref:hypothetical protein n=1 Tax=Streptomyces tauricus TaxID=68274 RepID=UPI001679F4AA|nr:hypothetical protein [Streptomyces tauricus]GHA54107.1 hypothetical protein GCM10010372_62820 [Streptomyces tauricus]
MSGAQRDVACVSAAFVLGVQQQSRQVVGGAAGARDVAGDRCGDPMPVLGETLSIGAAGDVSVVVESAVTARCVASGEVSEEDQIGCGLGERGEAEWWILGVCDWLWLGFCWTWSLL